MVGVCASVILSLHHKVHKFSWHWLTRVVPEKGRKTVVVVVSAIWIRCCEKSHSKRVAIGKNNLNKIILKVTQDHRNTIAFSKALKYGNSFTCKQTIPAFTPQPQSITALWLVLILWKRAFSLPGQFALRSESANRTLADLLPGQIAPWRFRSLAL